MEGLVITLGCSEFHWLRVWLLFPAFWNVVGWESQIHSQNIYVVLTPPIPGGGCPLFWGYMSCENFDLACSNTSLCTALVSTNSVNTNSMWLQHPSGKSHQKLAAAVTRVDLCGFGPQNLTKNGRRNYTCRLTRVTTHYERREARQDVHSRWCQSDKMHRVESNYVFASLPVKAANRTFFTVPVSALFVLNFL